ncbi:uncharacterized protein LOC134252827 [Saccostrea cucullata]|uniref:uncharacterized protein LOC134252827 n=1 Tax=Saccostrea cuccullata TaxID=36930 RepID=UPI002ED15F61
MSVSKDSFEKARLKAHSRILEWVEETKSAGITRLHDRYGEVFKRIEYKRKDGSAKFNSGEKTKASTKNEYNKRQSKGVSKTEQKMNKENVSPETRKSPPERCRSRQTPDSRKWQQLDNRSSHNRSSRAGFTSICSIEAVSLLCDDETVKNCESTFNLPPIIDKNKNPRKFKHDKDSIRLILGTAKMKLKSQKTLYREKLNEMPDKVDIEKNVKKLEIGNTVKRLRRQSVFRRAHKKKNLPGEGSQDSSLPLYVITSSDGMERKRSSTTPIQRHTQSRSGFLPQLNEIYSSDTELPTCMRTASSLAIGTEHSEDVMARPVSASKFTHTIPLLPTLRRVKSAKKKGTDSKETPHQAKSDYIKPTQYTLKRYIRKIMNVLHLLRVTRQKVKVDLLAECQNQKRRDQRKSKKEQLTFDPSYFKSATTTYGGLSNIARNALWKPIGHRTLDDVRILTAIIYRLPFFTKYSRSVKERLAQVVWYDQFEDDRIIIRQGDIGSRMYFVISGYASVQRTDIDPRTNSKIIQHLYDVTAGSTFGELALIRNMARNFSVICKGESEFLSLSKDEFNSILRKDYEDSWNKRLDFFRTSSFFEKLSDDQKRQMADMSRIIEFSNNRVIHGNVPIMTHDVFFIKSGKCEIVKKVAFVRCVSPYLRPQLVLQGTKSSKTDPNTFLDKPYGRRYRRLTPENHFLTVLQLTAGDYFGVGEDLTDTFIIAKGKVEIIALNAVTFSLNYTVIQSMRDDRKNLIPSTEKLARQFEANRKWMEYKKKVVNDVVKRRKKSTCASYQDVPEAILNEPAIPLDLINYEQFQ